MNLIIRLLAVGWIIGAQVFYERHVNQLEKTIKKQQAHINELLNELESYRE